MRKQNLFLVISMIFVIFLVTTGCGGNPTAPPIEEDFINIISVTPDSGLVDGVDTDFIVVVEYNGWSPVWDAEFLVDKGSGTHEFNVTVIPKDWGSQGDFSVSVGLWKVPFVIGEHNNLDWGYKDTYISIINFIISLKGNYEFLF